MNIYILIHVLKSDYDPSKIVYSFNKYFNCFAATLQEEEAHKLASKVIHLYK